MRVLGIWDLRTAQMTLGGLLFLAEEISAHAAARHAEIAGICFVVGEERVLPFDGVRVPGFEVDALNARDCRLSSLLSALFSLEGINTCYTASSLSVIKSFAAEVLDASILWPALRHADRQGRLQYRYGSSLFLQRFHREHGNIPMLHSKPEFLKWAQNFIDMHVGEHFYPVVVHLKNNPREKGCSNANFDEWIRFVEICRSLYPVRFVFIGNEAVDDRLRRLPDVVITREFGASLAQDLALIQEGFAFMGMASGPCTMALFGSVPYIIYKNPDHHAEVMSMELGGSDHFPFARRFQKIRRVFETSEDMIEEFKEVYARVDRRAWRARSRVCS